MKDPGPCPDPDKYILVKTREGSYWRRKRGTVKKANINAVFSRNAALTALTNDAASRLLGLLYSYMFSLDRGRVHAKIAGKLKRCFNEKGRMDFSCLKGFDFQPRHPIGNLLMFSPTVKVRNETLTVDIAIAPGVVKQHSRLVTEFYFELIIIRGHIGRKRSLRVDEEVSEVYPIEIEGRSACRLRMALPPVPWLAVLKVNCIEGNEMAKAPRNYGMAVIATGVGTEK